VMEKANAAASKAAVDASKKAEAEEASAPGMLKEKKFSCTSCGRAFSTQAGLMTHYMSKHEMTVAAAQMKANGETGAEGAAAPSSVSSTQSIPDLPTFIPTPIDITAMAPQSLTEANPVEAMAWRDVTLVPTATSYTNIHIVGEVVTVVHAEKQPVVELTVRHSAEEPNDSILVRCHGATAQAYLRDGGVAAGSSVAVNGILRMRYREDPVARKLVCEPEVVVAAPVGSLHIL
jgi:hypothetical protein